ncbi:hypothetical protein AHAS_Ahas16G0322500 [Arachis hypogaea]
MGMFCSCFNGGNGKRMTKEEERLASEEARAKAAEAAEKRQAQFENSAAGRAARAQQHGMAKQAANANKGEPVLKVIVLQSAKQLHGRWVEVREFDIRVNFQLCVSISKGCGKVLCSASFAFCEDEQIVCAQCCKRIISAKLFIK